MANFFKSNVLEGYANTVAKTGNYTLLSTDDVVTGSSSGGAFTLTLPSAVANKNKIFTLKKTDSTFTVISIATTSSQTVDGSTTSALSTQYETLQVISDGANWQVLSKKTNSEWATYSLTIGGTTSAPTKGTTTTDTARWRRVGDSIEVRYDYVQTGAGGAGSGIYLFPLPTGLTIDSAKSTTSSVNQLGVIGFGGINDGSTVRPLQVLVYDATNVSAKNLQPANPVPVDFGSGSLPLSTATTTFSFFYRVPVTNWHS